MQNRVSAGLRAIYLTVAVFSLTGVTRSQEGEATPGTPTPSVNPQAIKALERMDAYLRSLKAFEINSISSTDEVLDNGQKVQLDGTVRMQVRQPDRLHAEVKSDRKHRDFFYDGKNFTLLARRMNYYATVPAPPTLGELATALAKKHGIEVPLADLFYWGTEKASPSAFRSAISLGPAKVEGTNCEHYAFREEDVDWQLWIQKGETPLPRKLVITTVDEPSQPQHTSVLKWNTSAQFDDKVFTFTPPEGVNRIAMKTLDLAPTGRDESDKKPPEK